MADLLGYQVPPTPSLDEAPLALLTWADQFHALEVELARKRGG